MDRAVPWPKSRDSRASFSRSGQPQATLTPQADGQGPWRPDVAPQSAKRHLACGTDSAAGSASPLPGGSTSRSDMLGGLVRRLASKPSAITSRCRTRLGRDYGGCGSGRRLRWRDGPFACRRPRRQCSRSLRQPRSGWQTGQHRGIANVAPVTLPPPRTSRVFAATPGRGIVRRSRRLRSPDAGRRPLPKTGRAAFQTAGIIQPSPLPPGSRHRPRSLAGR